MDALSGNGPGAASSHKPQPPPLPGIRLASSPQLNPAEFQRLWGVLQPLPVVQVSLSPQALSAIEAEQHQVSPSFPLPCHLEHLCISADVYVCCTPCSCMLPRSFAAGPQELLGNPMAACLLILTSLRRPEHLFSETIGRLLVVHLRSWLVALHCMQAVQSILKFLIYWFANLCHLLTSSTTSSGMAFALKTGAVAAFMALLLISQGSSGTQ